MQSCYSCRTLRIIWTFLDASVEKVLVCKFYYISPYKFLLPRSCSPYFHWGSENLKVSFEKKRIPKLTAQKGFLSFTYMTKFLHDWILQNLDPM